MSLIQHSAFTKLAITSNNNSSWIYTVYNSLCHALSILCFHWSSGNGFQRRTFSFFFVPERFSCPSHVNLANSHITTIFLNESHSRLKDVSSQLNSVKSKSHYDRQSVGQSVLASGTHLGPATNFSFSLRFFFRQLLFVIL
jgi:hypothetical protein